MLQRALRENVNAQTMRLEFFLDLLDRMVQQLLADGESSIPHTLLLALLLRVKQAGRAVQLLSTEGLVEEILAIGRTLLELTINAVYLQHADTREVERYLQFHPESLSQDRAMMRRNEDHGLALRMIRRVGDLVGGGKQQEETWSKRSLMGRAQIADYASRIPIMAALVARCYPRGLSAVQGTVSSLNSFMSVLETGAGPKREDRFSDLTQALFGINLCMLTLCMYLNAAYRLGMDVAISEAAEAHGQSRRPLWGEAS